jgi:hypothetical protein
MRVYLFTATNTVTSCKIQPGMVVSSWNYAQKLSADLYNTRLWMRFAVLFVFMNGNRSSRVSHCVYDKHRACNLELLYRLQHIVM